MTEDQVKKGKDLMDRIEGLQMNRYKWENSRSIVSITLGPSQFRNGNDVRTDVLDFELIRKMAVDKLNENIEALRKEFKEL